MLPAEMCASVVLSHVAAVFLMRCQGDRGGGGGGCACVGGLLPPSLCDVILLDLRRPAAERQRFSGRLSWMLTLPGVELYRRAFTGMICMQQEHAQMKCLLVVFWIHLVSSRQPRHFKLPAKMFALLPTASISCYKVPFTCSGHVWMPSVYFNRCWGQ